MNVLTEVSVLLSAGYSLRRVAVRFWCVHLQQPAVNTMSHAPAKHLLVTVFETKVPYTTQ